MPCEACGAVVDVTDSEGGTDGGRFYEKWECVRGHWGRVSGESSAPPREWTRTGPVFDA